MQNLIAYLSLFYSENYIMKCLSIEKLSFLAKNDINILVSDFDLAQTEFLREAKFDIAQKIYVMKQEYFKS